MKTFALALVLSLTGSLSALAFDRQTTDALRACHDHVWDVPAFKDLPNAAVSVFPGIFEDGKIIVFWNVYWDDPTTRRAGNCTVINGTVKGFEDYTDMK